MPYDVFVAMFVFAAVTAFTPGPNNMVTASGVNFGLRGPFRIFAPRVI